MPAATLYNLPPVMLPMAARIAGEHKLTAAYDAGGYRLTASVPAYHTACRVVQAWEGAGLVQGVTTAHASPEKVTVAGTKLAE